MNRSMGLRSIPGALVLVWACVLTGCEGSSDPMALVLTNDTRASVLVDGDLPALEYLVAEMGLERELEEALVLWSRSWEEEGIGRWALRQAAYDAALPVLVTKPETYQFRLVEGTRKATAALEPLTSNGLPPDLRREIRLAVDGGREATEAWSEDRREEALLMALQAADRIRELTPPKVAERLVRRVEAEHSEVQRKSAADLDEDTLRRVERLLGGARDALTREDYPRAIQRAHYAHQLLLYQPGPTEP